jgi:glycosyltransferase involved in cell wall biosynthesis
MNVAIVTPHLVEGDAVGNDVCGMYRCLLERGIGASIFVEKNRAKLPTRDLHELDECANEGDLIIYHHSTSCEVAIQILERSPATLVVKYHNITPPRYFVGYSEAAALSCAEGIHQLTRLARLNALFLVDSAYNGKDLHAIGIPWHALPPFTQADALLDAVPHVDSPADQCESSSNVLVVGRVVPQKNLVAAVRGFARFSETSPGPCRLYIVGNHGLRTYASEVRSEADALGLDGSVVLTGVVDLPRLKRYYASADTLLLLSQHEGFGVPLVEAMALAVPAIATRAAAIPETCGDVVHYVDKGEPDEVAEAIGRVCDRGQYRDELIRKGRDRYLAVYDNRVIAGRFHELIDPLLKP